MANLIYVANMSLDGYTEDRDGKFDWTEPSEEFFRFITNIVQATRTHLYGRRMYEAMMVWETDPNLAAEFHSGVTSLRSASGQQNRVLQDVGDYLHSQNAA